MKTSNFKINWKNISITLFISIITLISYSQNQNATYGFGDLDNWSGHPDIANSPNTTAIGRLAGASASNGSESTYIGFYAGYRANGKWNVCIGSYAGDRINGTENMFLGFDAGHNYTSGSKSVGIGAFALAGQNNVFDAGGSSNTAIGYEAGRKNTGSGNFMLGISAGKNNTGNQNIFIGEESGHTNQGNFHVIIGDRPAENFTTGSNNILIGKMVAENLTSGSRNVFLGTDAGEYITSGSSNIVIGPDAGPTSPRALTSKLFIHNQRSDKPLIGGDFNLQEVEINGTLSMGSGHNLKFENSTSTKLDLYDNRYTIGIQGSTQYFRTDQDFAWYVGGNHNDAALDAGGGQKAMYLTNTNGLYINKGLQVGNSANTIPGAIAHFDGRVYISEDDSNLHDGDSATEAGFDDTTLQNYKDYLLWIEKGMVAEDVALVEISDWPDYVFSDDYRLPSIQEMKAFINANGHLQNMPSAADVEKNGFTVTDMTKRTLKTIEELTLHTIQQEDKIKVLESELDKQNKIIKVLLDKVNELETKLNK